MSKPKIIVLCGSSQFCGVMAVCAWILERDEKAIAMSLHLLPEWYCKHEIPDHLAEHEGVAEQMVKLHLRKIDLADEIFVVDYQYYIGTSTKKEIEYAKQQGKKIRWFSKDDVGFMVAEIIQGSLHHESHD